MENEPSEMIEGALGKPISHVNKEEIKKTAKGEKKSMKSDDYPEDSSKAFTSKDQAHAVLEVDGAEIEQPAENENSQLKGQSMFAGKTNSHNNFDEFEINPRLEVTSDLSSNGFLNEAGIEKAVEEALRQRSDKNENHDSKAAFVASEKYGADRDSEGHETDAINHESKHIVGGEGGDGNDTILEMNKIANEAGQVAMNLVNVSNFKVVIPGGKTYEISGAPGEKPVVTVVPDNQKEKDGKAVDKINQTRIEGMNASENDRFDSGKSRQLHSQSPEEKTVTAIQNGNKIDVHVDKKADNLLVPNNMPTTALEQPYPILDSSVAALMYHPNHVAMQHLPINEHPLANHHAAGFDDMHIEVNSSIPQHEAPKPQKLDPEVIKVEFLPEGISVDTASSKIAKKCGQEATKPTKKSSDCNEDHKMDNQEETEEAKTKTIDDQSKSKSAMAGKVVAAAQETKMFVAPSIMKGVPGDVTVVPAEKQEPFTKVLVQDIAGEKNESKVNFVKMSPISNEVQSFPVSDFTNLYYFTI